jgi:hypothetical protein
LAEENFGVATLLLSPVAALAGESISHAEQAINGLAADFPFSRKAGLFAYWRQRLFLGRLPSAGSVVACGCQTACD